MLRIMSFIFLRKSLNVCIFEKIFKNENLFLFLHNISIKYEILKLKYYMY
jgi:hypothetical protein